MMMRFLDLTGICEPWRLNQKNQFAYTRSKSLDFRAWSRRRSKVMEWRIRFADILIIVQKKRPSERDGAYWYWVQDRREETNLFRPIGVRLFATDLRHLICPIVLIDEEEERQRVSF